MSLFHKDLHDLGRPFWYLWAGQNVSTLGTGIFQTALGIWIFQKTGSVLEFSSYLIAGVLPTILILPFAGNVVDSFDRRVVLVWADLLTAALIVGLAALLFSEQLKTWHLYLFTGAAALMQCFYAPAKDALFASLVPKNKLFGASALIETSEHFFAVATPAIAGALLVIIGIEGLVVIEFATFLFGAVLMWRVFGRISAHTTEQRIHGAANFVSSSMRSFKSSFTFFKLVPAASKLIVYRLIQVVVVNVSSMMVIPLVLLHHAPNRLGLVMSCGAAGGVAGGVLMLKIARPKYLIAAVLLSDFFVGLGVFLAGIWTSYPGYCALMFLTAMFATISISCVYVVWLEKIPDDLRGRIFILIHCLGLTGTALTLAIVGVVSHSLDAGVASQSVTAVGDVSWVFLMSGSFGVMAAALAAFSKPLRVLA